MHPEFGLRLTGKLSGTNLGFFAIDDREPGETYAPGNPLYLERAKYFVGRISQDLGKNSILGLIYTDQEFGGGWNRIGGLDFTAHLNKNWTAIGQMVASSTMGPDDPANPPTYSAGPAAQLEFQRAGHSFVFDSLSKDYSTGFQTQLGFIPTTNLYSNQTHATYIWYPKKSSVQSVGIDGFSLVGWDHQGNRLYHYFTFAPYVSFARQIIIAPQVGENSDTVGPQDGYPLDHNVNFTQNFGGMVVRGAPWSQLNFTLIGLKTGNVNYNPVAGGVPSLLNAQLVQALITLQPIRRSQQTTPICSTAIIPLIAARLSTKTRSFAPRSTTSSRDSISARVIADTDSTLVNPAETSLQRTKQIQTQALFTWLPHPGTVIYVGYNNDIQNLDRSLCNREPGGACNPQASAPHVSRLPEHRQADLRESLLPFSVLMCASLETCRKRPFLRMVSETTSAC